MAWPCVMKLLGGFRNQSTSLGVARLRVSIWILELFQSAIITEGLQGGNSSTSSSFTVPPAGRCEPNMSPSCTRMARSPSRTPKPVVLPLRKRTNLIVEPFWSVTK